MLRRGVLGAFRPLDLVFAPLALGFLWGTERGLALPWCPLQPGLVLGSWKMSGDGHWDMEEGGFVEWSCVHFPSRKCPQGVPSPGGGNISRCWHLPPGQEGRQVAEPTRLPHLG